MLTKREQVLLATNTEAKLGESKKVNSNHNGESFFQSQGLK